MYHIKNELRSWYEDSMKFEKVPSNPVGKHKGRYS